MKRQMLSARLNACSTFVLFTAFAEMGMACPHCNQTANTFVQDIEAMDVAVIARLSKIPAQSEETGQEIQKATFEITSVLKGDGLVKQGDKFETLYFGNGKLGKSSLVMRIDPPKVMWSTPLPLSDRAVEYLGQILALASLSPLGLRLAVCRPIIQARSPLFAMLRA